MKQILLNSFRLNATLLVAVMCVLFTGQAWADTTTYIFTDASWTANSGGSDANWTSGKDGGGFSNNGIQVTTTYTGANGTSPVSFTNITKIVATYNTNKSAGAGSIVAKIGNNSQKSNTVGYSSGDGRTANYTTTFNYATPQTGYVKITCNTTTNSIYLVSVAITYQTPVTGVSLNKSETTLEVGNTETLTATVAPANADNKNVSWESDDTAVATVDASGVVTAVAAGTANITVTTDDGSYSASCAVTVNAASDTKPSADPVTVFYESFDKCSAIGGNDGTWSGITGTSYNPTTDQAGWTWGYQAAANKCSRYGTGSALGYAQTPSLALEAGITYTLTFKAGAWNGSSESTNLKLSATKATLDRSSVSMSKGVWTTYTVTITNASAGATVKFEGNSASNSRFFLDEVRITKPGVSITSTSVTTHKHYATYCYQYPLDLDGISGAKAYIVNAIDKDNKKLTLTQITGTIKGGVPFVLKSDEESAEIDIPLAEESNVVPEGNLLVGTLAPTFVEQVVDGKTNFAYSKSNGCFVKLSAAGNTVPANRAYLPINLNNEVKAFTFSFEDADGIRSIDNGQLPINNGQIFNLAGQRIDNSQFTIHNSQLRKGIYIVNGKKVLVK